MAAFNPRFSRDRRDSRMSIESSMTFDSLAREKLFDGEELFDVWQSSQSPNDASNVAVPPMQIIKTTKRPSAKEFESGEFYFGKDIVDVFNNNNNKQPDKDNDNSMGMSYHSYRRRSTMSRDKRDSIMSFATDRRESLMSLMSLADCSLIENPTPLQEPQQQQQPTDDIAPKIFDTSILPIQKVEQATTNFDDDDDKNNNNNNNNNKIENSNPVVANNNRTDNGEEIERIENIGPYDIICGRNNGAHNWVGNRRFRITIMMNLKRYTEAPTREEKTQVIKSVIDLLLNTEGVGARFIKKVGDGAYVRLKEKQIREKVGHAFRDMISLAEQEGGKLEAKCFQ